MSPLDILCTQWSFTADAIQRIGERAGETEHPTAHAFRIAAWQLAWSLAELDTPTQPVKVAD